MSANPYDALPWWAQVSSGAGGNSVYDTVVTTNINDAAQRAAAITAAVEAVVWAARVAATQGAARDAVVYAARVKAQQVWRANTGSDQGYSEYEPSIFDKAASILSSVTGTASPVIDGASQAASVALRTASATGLGALFGGAGTAVILGAGALILLVLLKR